MTPTGHIRRRPRAIVISGPPASGKSSLGVAVARNLGAALLDQDVVTGPLTDVLGDMLEARGNLDDPELQTHGRRARYQTIIDTAACNLRIGTSVVLVAPFTRERRDPRAWAAVREALRLAGAAPELVWMRCPPKELLRRMGARAAERDRGKLADPRAFVSSPALFPPAVPHTVVDVSWPLQRQVQAVLMPHRWERVTPVSTHRRTGIQRGAVEGCGER